MPKLNRNFIVSGLALMLLAITTVGCDGMREYTELERMERAKDFIAKHDFKSAEIELKNVLHKNANHAEARWLLGEVHLDIGRGAEAEKEFSRAQQLGVSETALFLPKARAYLMQREFDRALRHLEAPPNKSPGFIAQVEAYRGEALLGLGKGFEACALFEQAKRQDDKLVRAHIGLAKCAIAKNQLEQVRPILEQALSIDPNHVTLLSMYGDFERVQRQNEAAKKFYEKALKAHPNHLDSLAGVALIALVEGRTQEAQGHAKTILRIAPGHPTGYMIQGIGLYADKKYRDALTAFDHVLKVAPGNLPGLLWSGMTNLALKHHESAKSQLEIVVGRDRANAQARRALAAAYIALKLPEQALIALDPMLVKGANDVGALTLAGEAYLALNKPDRANAMFSQAAEIAPQDATIRSGLGLARLAAGNSAQAIAELEIASRLDQQNTRADLMLASIHLKNRQFDQVIKLGLSMVKKWPDDPIPLNILGTAYLGKQDFKTARKYFEQALETSPTFFAAASNLATLDMRENKTDAARQRFEAVLKHDKNNLPAMMALAEFARLQKQDKSELAWYERASRSHPGMLQPLLAMVRYHLSHNNAQQAIAIAREAQAANPDSPEALDLLGATQLAVGQTENALASYLKLSALDKQNASAYAKLGHVQLQMGRVEDARQSLARAIELNPKDTVAVTRMIQLEALSNRIDAALGLARSLQQQHPKNPIGYISEGDILMGLKRYPDALKAYSTAYAIQPSGRLVTQQHQVLMLMKQPIEAKAKTDSWMKRNPDDVVVIAYLAERALVDGHADESVQLYELLLKLSPQNALALNNLAGLYFQKKDPRAMQAAEKAYALMPDHPGIQDTLGWILLDKGKLAQATSLLSRAVQGAPNVPVTRYHYAVALHKNGNLNEARKQLEVALASRAPFPERSEAQAMLVRIKK